jgi:hypothetical protein
MDRWIDGSIALLSTNGKIQYKKKINATRLAPSQQKGKKENTKIKKKKKKMKRGTATTP